MIAKRIQNRKGTSSFARLSRYVVDARGQIDPRTWSRTADYILDSIHDGAKVGGVRITNCSADEPAAATLEVLATQALNTRSKSDKTYHLVVSFPAGEKPTMATMHAIEDRLCEAIGLADHQRLSAVHNDTAHLHIHIAINKVHPKTRRNVEPYYDQQRLMEACERLEVEYGLQRTN
ncbi:relaxase/mobilization nuclease domain-containing protein, partial [Dokdonella sp.]|uniref:relaxase/mobilization nuclease domain-containing protein n=1 Tax=Dokdonella sp. TaxID=2291710 RepID=UPI0027BAC6DB